MEDEDGDSIELEVTARVGNLSPVSFGVPANPTATTTYKYFSWTAPSNPLGNTDPVNAELTLTASDPSGASSSKVIPIWLYPPGSEGGLSLEGTWTFNFESSEIQASSSLSGFVASDGQVMTNTILVGDSSDNRQYKGYLTFNLSNYEHLPPEIWTIPEVRDSLEAYIEFRNINESGEPAALADIVDFKAFRYGSSLDAADFAVGGTRIYQMHTEAFRAGADGDMVTYIAFGSTELNETILQALSEGRSSYQVKMGLNRATNNNNRDDFFMMHSNSVYLFIDFGELSLTLRSAD